jgi:hypothetical protein
MRSEPMQDEEWPSRCPREGEGVGEGHGGLNMRGLGAHTHQVLGVLNFPQARPQAQHHQHGHDGVVHRAGPWGLFRLVPLANIHVGQGKAARGPVRTAGAPHAATTRGAATKVNHGGEEEKQQTAFKKSAAISFGLEMERVHALFGSLRDLQAQLAKAAQENEVLKRH